MADSDSVFVWDLNETYAAHLDRDAVSENSVGIPPNNLDETVPETPENRTYTHNVFQAAVNTFDGIDVGNEIVEPAVGMVFPSGDEFAAFIYTYAYRTGIELFRRTNEVLKEYKIKGAPKRGKQPVYENHMYKRLMFKCRKGGDDKHERSNVTDCGFYVDGRIRHKQTMFEITACHLVHNHPTYADSTRFMASYRGISDYFKKRMMNNDVAGISLVNNYNSLVLEAGGHENLPFNSSDLRNCVNLERRRTRLGGDAKALEEYFIKKKLENHNFFYTIQRDGDNRLLNVFWADARSRSMFKSFPDAITYDTTFSTNRFEMPFSPFVGVNHHGKSTLFAAALISHEDSETFEWVFNQWLECMGKAPSIIITDQCKAIGKAVRNVFGIDFPHRLCLWHIMRNAAKNLGSCAEAVHILGELRMVVHDSLDSLEFEEMWSTLVAKYNIENNPWIKESYEIRRQWAPVYWRGVFCAGMSSTQRSEQQNRFLKEFVSIQSGLRLFLTQFEYAVSEKVNEEHRMNYQSLDRPLKLVGGTVVEAIFQKLYTNNIFKLVQAEVYGLMSTHVVSMGKLGTCALYSATDTIADPPWRKGRRSFDVKIDGEKGDFTCGCKLFEFRGILCRHLIRCLELEDVKFIPDKYILDRWRKDLVRGYEHIKVGDFDPEQCSRVRRSLEITHKNEYVSQLALQDEEAYIIYTKGIAALQKQLEDHVGIDSMKDLGTGAHTSKVWCRRRLQRKEQNQRHILRNASSQNPGGLKDPVDKRGNGRAKITRQKNFKRKYTGSSQPTPSKTNVRRDEIDLNI